MDVLTLASQDYEWSEGEEPERVYTEAEIAEAIANQALTGDQAWYLHTQGVSWQIDLRK